MSRKICLFYDYLSDISPREKESFFLKLNVEVIGRRKQTYQVEEKKKYDATIEWRDAYREVANVVRHRFGRYAPDAMQAMIRGHTYRQWSNIFSQRGNQFLHYLLEADSLNDYLLAWALNQDNWIYINSEMDTQELEASVSDHFPCAIFDDVPLECLASEPDVHLENIEEVLESTGIYQAWDHDNYGQNSRVVILDTGITKSVRDRCAIKESAVNGLSCGDNYGHGTAVTELILALAPKARIESVKVIDSATSGNNIWNLLSGLTDLYRKSDRLVNVSLGVKPSFMGTLDHSSASFETTLTNVIKSAASQKCFVISAAGNDGCRRLRWPSAAPDALAVGAHNKEKNISSFSNFSKSVTNYILSPGGDVCGPGCEAKCFGKYGISLNNPIYGTSFSCAIATAVAAILHGCSWFKAMDVPSRISLLRNNCKTNSSGFPILNLADIGAVWPLECTELSVKSMVGNNSLREQMRDRMLPIQGGKFTMGDEATGRVEVTLSNFKMDKYPVTQALYEQVMNTNPSYFKGEDRPVEMVSWFDAVGFCNELSRQTGLEPAYEITGEQVRRKLNANGYRLPTEAEWEYACRAGTTGDHYGELDGIAWYDRNSGGETHGVGQKKANGFGLHDMLGNVWEWCNDWYGHYPEGPVTDPAGIENGSYRVLRGGSWGSGARRVRAAFRDWYTPDDRYSSLGFRLVLPPGQ
jgi:formylglycine-generating enzyme required for sulfatase activity